MSYKFLFVLNALLAVALGAAFLFVPETTLKFFGAEARVPELLLGRFFGSALFTIGLLLWFAKESGDENVNRNLGLSLLVGAVLGLIVTIIGMSSASGVIRANGWMAILIYVLFALGYAFMLFLKPKMKE